MITELDKSNLLIQAFIAILKELADDIIMLSIQKFVDLEDVWDFRKHEK